MAVVVLTKDVWLSCIFKRLSVIDLTQLSATCKRLKELTAMRLQGGTFGLYS